MNYRKNYLATTMASSSFLIDLVHVMSGEQLYRASFEHPELLCLPFVEWKVHEYVMSTPFVCTAPTRNRRVCGERFATKNKIEDHWWTHSRDMRVIVDDFFSIKKK